MLMLRLDDAMKVLVNRGYYTPDEDEDITDSCKCCLRSDLEQKCYLFSEDDNEKVLKECIDAVTDVEEVCHHIEKGNLIDWLTRMHDCMTGMLLTICSKKGG